MTKSKSIPTDQKETLNFVDDAATQLDEQRLAGLQEQQNTQLIKDEVLQREMQRLALKHGEDHWEVVAAQNRLVYNREMHVSLDREIEKASIKTEPLPENAWRVHGRVFDQNVKPVKGVTVFLSDQKGGWIELLGSSCTSELGYYSLTVDEKIIDQIGRSLPVVLSVSDKNKKVIYMAKETLLISKGQIVYRDIYLKQEECVAPPGDTRGEGKEGKETKDVKEAKEVKDVKRKT